LGQREHHREPAGFRAAVGDPAYEQDDCNGVREVYGLANEDAMNQVLGSAETHAGRVLAFPNILQHHVGPFRLADPSRPGHRKVLVFFLVDPPADAGAEVRRRRAQRENLRARILALRALISAASERTPRRPERSRATQGMLCNRHPSFSEQIE
jgi:hypothetical protein